MKTYLIIGGIAAAIVAVAVGARLFDEGITVEAARARTASIRETIDERGKTRLPHVHNVTMPFTGRIEEITLVEGTPVKEDQVVAQVVPEDLKLSMDAATAAVERLDASIKENDDASVENVSLKQSHKFVESMDRSVEAAKERGARGQGQARLFAKEPRPHLQALHRPIAGPRPKRNTRRPSWPLVQADVDYQQDQLVLRAMEAMQAATNLMPVTLTEYIGRKKLSHDVLERERRKPRVRWQEAKRDQDRGPA